ncbi:MAG: IPExxxVDY family protein [Bacteroidales bacterium]|nr:IPExxxVDY family protein [Bacteroidales bacterium]
MAKKIKLRFDPDTDDQLIGISFHKNDYLLAFGIKSALDMDLRRIPDLPVPLPNSGSNNMVPLFYYDNRDKMSTYFLISNLGSEGRLFPALRNIDYFFLINGSGDVNEMSAIIGEIKRIKYVLTAFPLDVNTIKQADLLMSYLELHLIDINRSDRE